MAVVILLGLYFSFLPQNRSISASNGLAFESFDTIKSLFAFAFFVFTFHVKVNMAYGRFHPGTSLGSIGFFVVVTFLCLLQGVLFPEARVPAIPKYFEYLGDGFIFGCFVIDTIDTLCMWKGRNVRRNQAASG